MAAAALAMILWSQAASAPPETSYLVAARDLSPGDRLTDADVTHVVADLPDGLAQQSFADSAVVVGATVLSPVAAGELVQVSDLIAVAGPGGLRQMSFPVETDLALAGRLRSGELIDVVATFGSGPEATSEIVASQVPVVRAGLAEEGLAGRFTILTVAVADDEQATALARAVRAGEIVIVRTTGATSPEVAS